jgi:hypothetical protein
MISYRAGTWNKRRDVVVKIARTGANDEDVTRRYLVTNIVGKSAKQLYKSVYCPRGDMENRLKEQQLGLFADRTSSSKFLANQLRLLLSSAAYLLFEHIRRTALTGTEFAAAQCSTIRTKLLKIGAVIMKNTRRIQIRMAGHYPYQAIFMRAAGLLTSSG